MIKKNILVKNKFNRLSVALMKDGKKDNKAEFRIWVTKGKPIYDETMAFDLDKDDPDEFINKVNDLLKSLKETYFDNYYDEKMKYEKQKKCMERYRLSEKGKETRKKYFERDDVKEKMRQYRQKYKEKAHPKAIEYRKKYRTKVKAAYSGKKDWDPEEDNYLRNNMDTPLTEVALHLGRSISSVSMRKYKIKNNLLYMK